MPVAVAGGAVNIHPKLLPPSVELAPAYHPAPPVAVDLLIDRKSELTVPLAFDSVWLAAVSEPMVKSLVDSPLAFQSVNVFVVPAVNKIDVALTLLRVLVMSLNVFEPVMVNAPAPPWFSVQLNVEPAPTNVLALAEVMEITPVPVPAVVVKLVGCALLNAVVFAPDMTNVPPLKVRFFVPVPVVNLSVCVAVNPARSSVPFVNVRVEQDSAVPSDQPPPTPLKLHILRETPLVVMVLPVVVALNEFVPVLVRVKFVVGQNNDPLTVNETNAPASVIAPSRPDAVKSLQTLGEFAIVTVNAVANTFEFASKNTLSDAVGTEAPPAPPDDADQLVVLVLLQVPVPRIQ